MPRAAPAGSPRTQPHANRPLTTPLLSARGLFCGQEELLALQAALWPNLAGGHPMRTLIEHQHVREEDLDFRGSDPKAVVLSFIRLEDAIFVNSLPSS